VERARIGIDADGQQRFPALGVGHRQVRMETHDGLIAGRPAHRRRAFAKLGVRTRRELFDRVPVDC
ncbi:hypothetical protein LAN32_22075, partial [Mycobacterium tuberculosis]|nr:hypothetical protein [Mycobacterium tuberculosis]